MTATYPLSIQRRIEQKWAERLKLAATPKKAVGRVEATLDPVAKPEPPQLSTPSAPRPGHRSAA